MRIAFVTNSWAFQLPGGGEQTLLQSREALQRLGHDVTLFDPWAHKFSEFDLVHYFHCPGWDGWARIKAFGRPLVVTPTLWYDRPRRGWSSRQLRHAVHRVRDRWWNPPIDERAVHHHLMIPDLLLPASASEADRLHLHAGIPRERMRVVMNAVAVDEPAEMLPPNLSDALMGHDRLLSVGSFHQVKNQLGLIRALAVTPLRVTFIGGRYPDDPAYLDRCRAAAGDQHWFFPELPRPLVLSAMRHSSVYIQPSLRETCGLAALEAAALGCRVVMTARGGTREYFGDHVWYFDPENADDMRNAVVVAAASEDSGTLALHVRARHSLERLGRDLEATYQSLVRES